MTTRRAAILLGLLVVVVGILLVSAPGRGYWVIDPDAAAYVGLARSLVSGDGYALQGIPHAKFPPGYPLLLSIAIWVTGDRECYGAMRDLTTLMGLFDIVLAYAVARRILRFQPGGALFLAFGTAVSIYMMQYTVAYLRSETTFTAFLLAALVSGENWREKGGFGRAVLTGILAAGSVATRSAGIAVVGALAIARLFQRESDTAAPRSSFRIDRRALLEIALFGFVSVAPAIVHSTYVKVRSESLGIKSSNYGDELFAAYALDLTKDVDEAMPKISPFSREMAVRIEGNLAALGLSLGKFVLNDNKGANLATSSKTGRLHPGGIALLSLLGLGFCIAVRKKLVVAAVLTALYVGLYLIWPFNQQQRFYQPIAPILLGLLAYGAQPLLAIAGRIAGKPIGRALISGLCFALVAILAWRVRSDAAAFGGYSRSLLLLMSAPLLVGIAFLALSVVPSLQAIDLTRAGGRLRVGSLLLLGLLWAASFRYCLADLLAKQQEFEQSRAVHPVAAQFAKIKVQPELVELLEKLLAEAKPGDVVMSDIPKMIHEMTGLTTTPLRFNSATRELVMNTPVGRPRFLYVSPEIEQANAVFDHVLAGHPSWLTPLHEIEVQEGSVTTKIALYRVGNAD